MTALCVESGRPRCTWREWPWHGPAGEMCRFGAHYSALCNVPVVMCENEARTLRAAAMRGAT